MEVRQLPSCPAIFGDFRIFLLFGKLEGCLWREPWGVLCCVMWLVIFKNWSLLVVRKHCKLIHTRMEFVRRAWRCHVETGNDLRRCVLGNTLTGIKGTWLPMTLTSVISEVLSHLLILKNEPNQTMWDGDLRVMDRSVQQFSIHWRCWHMFIA